MTSSLAKLLASVFMASTTSPAARPSFDCSRARSDIEEAICRSPALAKLDVELDQAFSSKLNEASVESKKVLLAGQRAWLKERDTECSSEMPGCIERIYHERMEELTNPKNDGPISCPAERVLSVDLAAWKVRMQGARDAAHLLLALRELRLPRNYHDLALTPDQEEYWKKAFAPSKTRVDDFVVRLTKDGAPEHVVQVTAQSEAPGDAGEEQNSTSWLRYALVLKPLGEKKWCDLGLLIAQGGSSDDECPTAPTATFAFENLISPDTKVIRVDGSSTLCNPRGRDERSTRTMSYWYVGHGRIKKAIEIKASENGYNVISGSRSETNEVKTEGEFPKMLVIRSTSSCGPGMASTNYCNPGDDGDDRKGWTHKSKHTFVFDGNRYIEQK